MAHVARRFFEACARNDVASLSALLAEKPGLLHSGHPSAQHAGWTGLHEAARSGHLEAVRFLLARGADPNAREAGDNTTPLHWAAAAGHVEVARALLDAGADVHGFGDVHALDIIGWAAFYHPSGPDPGLLALLLERGARHHVFSAICTGDLALVRAVVEQNRDALHRRMSRFEHGQTPLHFAIARRRYDVLGLLIELGAELEAKDDHGRTSLEVAILHADRQAVARLRSAGAAQPPAIGPSELRSAMAKMAASIQKGVPMIYVPDVARALQWYASIGFHEIARYGEEGVVNFGMVSFGKAELMLNMNGKAGAHDVTLWFYTSQVDQLYQLLKSRQLAAEPPGSGPIQFEQHLEDMFYGARQFAIRDPDGYILYFIQSTDPTAETAN